MDNLAKALDVLSRLGEVTWRGRTQRAFTRGLHPQRKAGSGDSFWQFRAYAVGDSSRDVDWKQTGRRDALFVREKQHQAQESFMLWCDTSTSMEFSTQKFLRKKDYAEILLYCLSVFLLDQGEKISWPFPGSVPVSGDGAIYRLRAQINKMPRDVPDLMGRVRSLLISDFYFSSDILQQKIEGQRPGLVVQIFDPAEKDFPFAGRMLMDDPETQGREGILLENAADFRTEMQARFIQHQQALANICAHNGWPFLSVSTQTDLADVVLRVIERMSDG